MTGARVTVIALRHLPRWPGDRNGPSEVRFSCDHEMTWHRLWPIVGMETECIQCAAEKAVKP
jgi:hypothetical protein